MPVAWFLFNDRVKLGTYKIFDGQNDGLMAHFWEKHKQDATAKYISKGEGALEHY
jgi:hypothetical protein